MKRLSLLSATITIALLLVTTFSLSVYAQPMIYESFDYPAGSLVDGVKPWITHSGTTAQIQVIDTESNVGNSLSYTGYPAPAGNRIFIREDQSEDVSYDFVESATSGTLYAAFLINVATQPVGADGNYFAHFTQAGSTSIFHARVFVRTAGAGVNLGLSFSATGGANPLPTFDTTELPLNTTHLVVAKYEFVDGTTNDIVSLFINPVLPGTEPTPTLQLVNSAQGDNPQIGRFSFRQSTASGQGMAFIEIDELRIGTTYQSVTELSPVGHWNQY